MTLSDISKVFLNPICVEKANFTAALKPKKKKKSTPISTIFCKIYHLVRPKGKCFVIGSFLLFLQLTRYPMKFQQQ